jgi:hypothetical protein
MIGLAQRESTTRKAVCPQLNCQAPSAGAVEDRAAMEMLFDWDTQMVFFLNHGYVARI